MRTLYGFWLSPYMSMAAHMLKESGLEFNYERVSPFTGATLVEEHKKRNPFGKIPCLKDSDGTLISESQAICRYISREYPETENLYSYNNSVRCAEIDSINDFITFSISSPFFSWFFAGAYFPQAFHTKTEKESEIFSSWSMVLVRGGLMRLAASAKFEPFLLGEKPCLPDFQLFHVLQLGKTFSKMFNLPFMNLTEGDEVLQNFYTTMAERSSTQEILQSQKEEYDLTKKELFEEFGNAYADQIKLAKVALEAFFGHEI